MHSFIVTILRRDNDMLVAFAMSVPLAAAVSFGVCTRLYRTSGRFGFERTIFISDKTHK